jgi:uncharacterized protein (DUF1501 family)
MNRRSFAKGLAGACALAFSGGRLLAAPAGQARFLLVFLRGGYDAASLLVPITSDFYYQSRPEIAIARPSGDLNAALALDAEWGLHPALRETVHPLYLKGEAAFIPFAGTADTSRSHFETQDDIELGQPPGGGRNYRSGFLNRLAGVMTGADPIAFTDQLPIVFQGAAAVPNTSLRAVAKSAVDARQSQLIASMYQDTALAVPVSEGFAVRDRIARDMAGEMAAASRNAMTSKGFELEARRIARLMKDRYNLGFVDVGGWDTHVGQGGATGTLAGRFEELSRGLAAYAQEMGAAWRDTSVVVVSEFGRTFRQNGNRGTDHGHGTVFWVLGGSVRGGRIAGEQVRVEAATLFQNRDYQVCNEYRAVLGGLFARQFGLDRGRLEQVFAGARPIDLGLL